MDYLQHSGRGDRSAYGDWPEFGERRSLTERAREWLDRAAANIAARVGAKPTPTMSNHQDDAPIDEDWGPFDADLSQISPARRLGRHLADALAVLYLRVLDGLSLVDEFTQLWLSSRPRRQMLAGLLPAVLFVAWTMVFSSAGSVPHSLLIDQYRLAAYQASNRGDDASARLWLQKIAWLDPDDPDYQYRLALGAADSGDRERAAQIMRRLAPDDRPGYGPAHFWQARRIVRETAQVPRARVPVLRHHLKQAVQHDRRNGEAAEMLAQLELQDGDAQAATAALEPVVRFYPELRLMLARLYLIAGDTRRAASVAQSALGIFQRRLEKQPDGVAARIQCARLLTFQQQFEQAVLLLQEGADRLRTAAGEVPDSEQQVEESVAPLRTELADTLIAWHDWVRRMSPLAYADRLRVLQLAVNAVPHDRRVLERMALLAAEGRDEATDARAALTDALADGTAPATVHLLLSLEAQNRQDRRAEEQHLRMALALNPRLAAAANNLAWLLANDPSPDLENALALIQRAHEVAPDHPEIRATRGVIYHKLGRHEDAAVDLEFALAEVGSRTDLHAELASLYETLGHPDLAERHRTRANRN
jgi:tetratricopeptide (TPR) repeat protein